MEVAIRKMGNSQGVLIPKPILAQVGLEGSADLQVLDGVIEIRPVRRDLAQRDECAFADGRRRAHDHAVEARTLPHPADLPRQAGLDRARSDPNA